MAALAAARRHAAPDLDRLPLLGTCGGEHDPIEITVNLVQEAKTYLSLRPDTHIREVYFLAYTKRDFELCEAAFQRLGMRVG